MPRPSPRDADSRRVAAVRDVVLELAEPVFAFLYASTGDLHTAQDLTQDTMLRAWDQAPNLRDGARARGWVFAIAANAVRSHWRRARRFSWMPLEMLGETADPRPAGGDCTDVAECLGRLRRSDREIIMLVAHSGFNLKQAADVVGISVAAAEKRWQRGRDRLRRLLEGEA